jgi:hypothetical protein
MMQNVQQQTHSQFTQAPHPQPLSSSQLSLSANLNRTALQSLAQTHSLASEFWSSNFGDVEAVQTNDFKIAVKIRNNGLDISELDNLLKQELPELVEAKIFKMLVVGNGPLSQLFVSHAPNGKLI